MLDRLSPHLRNALALTCATSLLASCVTETVERPSRGVTVKPNRTPGPAAPGGPSRSEATLPSGPITSPVLGASMNSRIQVSILPLGAVEYDGQVLPIVSPSGNFIAVQEGEPPTWPTLLAEPDSFALPGTRVAIYSIGDKGLTRETLADAPSPLLLGRAADDSSVLVEHPRPDGSRWIGRMDWVSGSVRFLVQGDSTNFHAVLLTPDELVYCRRAPGESRVQLVLRTKDGAEIVRDDPSGSFAMPIATGDPSVIHALFRGPDGLEVQSIRISRSGSNGTISGPRFGASLARRVIVANTEPAMAYQIIAPVQSIAATRPSSTDPGQPLVLFHPAPNLARMVVFDFASGAFLPMPEKCISAAHFVPTSAPSGRGDAIVGQAGFFCTTPDGLSFAASPRTPSRDGATRRAVPVLASPFVARATSHTVRNLILFGPRRNEPTHLDVMALSVTLPVPEER